MRRIVAFLMVIWVSAFAAKAEEQKLRIVVVDLAKVFQMHPKAKEAEEKIEAAQKQGQAELDDAIVQLHAMKGRIDEMAEEVRKVLGNEREASVLKRQVAEKEREAKAFLERIEQMREEREKQMANYNEVLSQKVREELNTLVLQLFKDADIILDRSAPGVNSFTVIQYASPALDRTDEVLKALGVKVGELKLEEKGSK